ncbi:MAG: YraN family protein [Paracoccaceae bacterium]
MAEDSVARVYRRHGMPVAARRWRGPGGEVDLIVQGRRGLVFVEVKRAETHDAAAERIDPRQIARIHASAECYAEPGTEMRFDLATVDARGTVRILPGALRLD